MYCKECNHRNVTGARFCTKCGAELDIIETPEENVHRAIREIKRGSLLFHRYEVIEEIGSGGMGKVFRVFDRVLEESIALKIINPEIATDKMVISRFNQELKTARKITHRNVCRMYDIGEEDGIHYITMEYVTGEDLKSLIRRIGQLPVGKTIDIAKQICEGLAEAHAMGVIHRDIKPQNIMIDKKGMAKIMDFGIARFIKTKSVTTTGMIVGTPEYMPPEQAEGKAVDRSSDIYSLGILLFEALTGKVPFEGETPLSIALKHTTEPPPDPRKLNDRIPSRLNKLISKCLEKYQKKRYQNVSEMIAELEKIEKAMPTSQRAIFARKPLRKREGAIRTAKKRILIPGIVMLVLAALALGTWFLWIRPKPADPVVSSPEILLKEGNLYWAEKKYPEALDRFRHLLVRDPGNFEAQLSVARILKEQGKSDESILDYMQSLGLKEIDPRVLRQPTDLASEKHGESKVLNDLQEDPAGAATDFQDDSPSTSTEKVADSPPPIADNIPASQKPPRDENTGENEEQIEKRIRDGLIAAQGSCDRGDFEDCLKQSLDVLKLDPHNDQANKYIRLSNEKLLEAEISSMVDQYVQAFINNNPVEFYKAHCTTQLYEEIHEDAERISGLYENFKPVASNLNIRLAGIDRVDLTFHHWLMGTSKVTGAERELSNGTMQWNLNKQGGSWKITQIVFQPFK
ncbi:MAG: protein kinase [Candidatus Krumholzibacteriota bacterium]|nr:protein kinase [Candidatus Krumholzibacteriota bacterium]